MAPELETFDELMRVQGAMSRQAVFGAMLNASHNTKDNRP